MPKDEFDQIVRNTETVKRWVIMLGIGLILLGIGKAFAASYYLEDRAGNRITLHDTDCPVSFLKGWKQAAMRWKGQELTACWVASDGLVYVVDSLGDLTPIPVQAFRKAQEG